jgi:GPH family glycoside/pentoside/hexuronide:cation symporter
MPQLATTLGGGRQGYGAVGIILGLAIVVTMGTAAMAALRTRRVASTQPGERGLKRFAIVFKNRPFVLIMSAKVMQLIGLASMTASILFLLKSVLGAPDSAAAYYVGGSTAGMLLTLPLWARLNKRFSKQTLYMVGCLGYAIMVLTWLLATRGETLMFILLRGFAVGIFTGGLLLMGQSLLPDAIDEDCRRSGVRREGVYAGAYSLIEKAASALGPLIIGIILQIFKFQPSLGRDIDQPADAITGIYFGAAILPALLYALSVVPLFFFRLEPVADVPEPAPAAAE